MTMSERETRTADEPDILAELQAEVARDLAEERPPAGGPAYQVIPALGTPLAINAFKWTLAAALILPQSVLLGMTFPLMTGGLLRLRPRNSGYAIAMLYFTNSLGAGVGVQDQLR